MSWLDYHKTANPGLAGWLSKNPDTLQHWNRLLEPYSEAELRAATDELYGRQDQPPGFGAHARYLAGICRERRQLKSPKLSQALPSSAKCRSCGDRGTRSVVHPRVIDQLNRGNPSPWPITYCSVACSCAAGERWELPAYNPDQHVSWEELELDLVPGPGETWRERREAKLRQLLGISTAVSLAEPAGFIE